MPGHKGRRIFQENGFDDGALMTADWDITEIPGADNLFQAEGIIAETTAKYERLYGADKSFLLINGSSGGIIASILASVRRGGKLIMTRNCHKSVFNALSLGDISPVYVYPDIVSEYKIQELSLLRLSKRLCSGNLRPRLSYCQAPTTMEYAAISWL